MNSEELKQQLAIASELFYIISSMEDIKSIQQIAIQQFTKIDKLIK